MSELSDEAFLKMLTLGKSLAARNRVEEICKRYGVGAREPVDTTPVDADIYQSSSEDYAALLTVVNAHPATVNLPQLISAVKVLAIVEAGKLKQELDEMKKAFFNAGLKVPK